MKAIALVLLVTLASALGERAWERIHGSSKGKSPRITGGDEVVPHSVPWQVALDLFAEDGTYFCGGSLLAENIVLTAAHCCELTNNITVTAGAHYIRNASESTQQVITVANVTIHPNWDSAQLENDICILTLSQSAEINDAVGTIRLPSRNQAEDDFSDRQGTATGWGLDSDTSETISDVLRNVTAQILTNAVCREKFGILGLLIPLHPSNICTDGEGGKSTCSGDSGGPLIITNAIGENPEVVGITSFGISIGCEAGYPAVFTRVTSYLDWISLTTGIVIDE